MMRTRWAAIGAVIAISLGAGGLGVVNAVKSSGERGSYTAITACRLLDTRPNWGIGGRTTPLGPGDIHPVTATGTSGNCTSTPTDIVAVELNVTALSATGPTHLTIWPTGNVPNASSLNPAPGQPPVPNAVTTRVHTDGTFKIFNNSNSVHVIVDLVGYYQDHNHDDRYYTTAQTDQQIAQNGGGIIQIIKNSYGTGVLSATPIPFTQMRQLAVFTKSAANTSIRVTWSSNITYSANAQCIYQMRIDGRTSLGSTSTSANTLTGFEVVIRGAGHSPVHAEEVFDQLPAGQHELQLYLLNQGGSCGELALGSRGAVRIEEFVD